MIAIGTSFEFRQQAFSTIIVLEPEGVPVHVIFLIFAVLHLGVRIPLGFTTIGTDPIRDVAIAEGLSGALVRLATPAGKKTTPGRRS